MTITINHSPFTEKLSKHISCRINNNDTSYLKFYAVNPPLVPEKPFDLEVAKKGGYYNFPPTGSMYLCASIDSLKIKNIETKVIDLNNTVLKLANEVDNFEYKMWQYPLNDLSEDNLQLVFLVGYMFGTTKECYVSTVKYIRKEYPNAVIITGGVQATFDKEEILDSQLVDILCLNEGELQLQYLAKVINYLLNSPKDNSFFDPDNYSIPGGICFKTKKNEIIDSGETSQPLDFEWELSKYYDQIEIQNYYKYGGLGAFSKFVESYAGKLLPYGAVLTKRGCRAHCAFCTVRSFNGKGLRLRTVESVIKEIRYLYSKGIRHIDWLDDDLLFNESFNLELFEKIKEEFKDLVWTASNGLIGVAITPKLMKAMSDSGLAAFKIGVESGSSEVIRDIRKPTTLWKLLEKAKLIRNYPHIFFSANFIIGFPGETFSQMMDTFSFARKLQCDWASYYVCQPLKGTDLYSSFQHLMDPRTKDESYSKTINPGRSAARGEFAYSENQETAKELQAGWKIFELDLSRTFNANEHNEIWFTFNLVANFFDNPCYSSVTKTRKLIHWLLAIHSGYPFDASMTSALAHAYSLIGDIDKSEKYKKKAEEIILGSKYWQMRITSFPQILLLAGFNNQDSLIKYLGLKIPSKLVPDKYQNIFDKINARREAKLWKD